MLMTDQMEGEKPRMIDIVYRVQPSLATTPISDIIQSEHLLRFLKRVTNLPCIRCGTMIHATAQLQQVQSETLE